MSALTQMPWETRNLGRASYALNVSQLDQAAEELERLQHAFVQAALPLDQLHLSPQLAAMGFYAVETALTPYANLTKLPALDAFVADPASALPSGRMPEGLRGAPAEADDFAVIDRIAGQAFRDDRFHMDPGCDAALADQRYVLWVQQMRDEGKAFYCLKLDDDVIGFMVHADSHLPLAGLAPAHGQRGLGAFLWLSALDHLKKQGQTRITTGITANNTAVLNLYARLGFRFRDPRLILHQWIDLP